VSLAYGEERGQGERIAASRRRHMVGTMELSRHFGVSSRQIRKWVEQGRIPYYRMTHREASNYRFDLEEIAPFIAEAEAAEAAATHSPKVRREVFPRVLRGKRRVSVGTVSLHPWTPEAKARIDKLDGVEWLLAVVHINMPKEEFDSLDPEVKGIIELARRDEYARKKLQDIWLRKKYGAGKEDAEDAGPPMTIARLFG